MDDELLFTVWSFVQSHVQVNGSIWEETVAEIHRLPIAKADNLRVKQHKHYRKIALLHFVFTSKQCGYDTLLQ